MRVAAPGAAGVVVRSGLTGRLTGAARVLVVSAPAGSGKTVLLRSWISAAGLAGRAGWVTAGPDNRDPQRFWLSVLVALRATVPAGALVRAVTAAPDLDGWALVEQLLADLASLDEPVWLVVDDVHELGKAEVLRQLELLIMRAPIGLRFVLAARHDVRLGLHRLRLDGELAEIRADDLRFTVAEAGELLAAAGVRLPEASLEMLVERTEGWVAGLRLAALSLARHPDPERFAARFSGTERTVAEYLLAEVLDRQDERVRRLLLRTSILRRVNGELARLLTGDEGGERMLQDLEEANAFVVSLDPARSWFRYHQLFADLLHLELRRTAPGDIAGLHQAAADWFADNGHPMEAVRHAQGAQNWGLAVRLLADAWPGLHLDGRDATTRDLLAGFPADVRAADAEFAALTAAAELSRGALDAAERYHELAEQESASVPPARRGQAQLLLGITRLVVARRRGDLPTVAEVADELQAIAQASDTVAATLGQDLRALALINLGLTEFWTARFTEATRHLDLGRTLARRIGRPYLEFSGLGYQAAAEVFGSFELAAGHSHQAIELARVHGWTDKPTAGMAYMALGAVSAWKGKLEQAESWIQRAERILSDDARPGSGLAAHYVRGVLELAHGQDGEALTAFRNAEQSARQLAAPNLLVVAMRAFMIQALVRVGETETAERALDGDHDRGELGIALAVLRLAQDNPRAAVAALAPVVDGSAPLIWPAWRAQAFLLEAIAQEALGARDAAESALELALGLAEPDGAVLWFLLHPAPGLLERHARHRATHAALVSEALSKLTGQVPAAARTGPRPLIDPLSESELRVLRYLPTNLTAPEIADELSVSTHTVKTPRSARKAVMLMPDRATTSSPAPVMR